jgi:hypothetical protein
MTAILKKKNQIEKKHFQSLSASRSLLLFLLLLSEEEEEEK